MYRCKEKLAGRSHNSLRPFGLFRTVYIDPLRNDECLECPSGEAQVERKPAVRAREWARVGSTRVGLQSSAEEGKRLGLTQFDGEVHVVHAEG